MNITGDRLLFCLNFHYYYYYYYYTLGIKDPEGFGKIEESCRSDHYSGQSSSTKESCSSTPLNRCTSTETRWNKKAVSRLLLLYYY